MPELTPPPYLSIKFAKALYDSTPDALDNEQRERVAAAALRARELEQRILSSREAAGVVIGAEAIAKSLAEVSERFASKEDFAQELARYGLSHDAFSEEIARSVRVDAVLERISAQIQTVSTTDIEIFYLVHRERFRVQERRTMRHILITVNEEIADNRREVAHAKIEAVLKQCRMYPNQFADLALRHSECPTAMQGGLLGKIEQGTLFPALDEASFKMRPGEISSVLESPMGFHLLRCDNIEPKGFVPLSRVRDRIREQLLQARRQNRQRAWIKSLPRLQEQTATRNTRPAQTAQKNSYATS